jgi:hypothetical protein
VSGNEHVYDVIDWNFDRLNAWVFLVQVPAGRTEDVIVRPEQCPAKKVWASLSWRSVVFVRATKSPHRRDRYCKIALADPTGSKTKVVVTKGARDRLPPWFGPFQSQIRLKESVRPTRGTDAHVQVLVVPADDHAQMIRVFFALKVWTLQERFSLE